MPSLSLLLKHANHLHSTCFYQTCTVHSTCFVCYLSLWERLTLSQAIQIVLNPAVGSKYLASCLHSLGLHGEILGRHLPGIERFENLEAAVCSPCTLLES